MYKTVQMSSQYRLLFNMSGFQLTGCDSSVAESSSLYILMVLSASQVMSLDPVWSNVMAKTPASESSDPGWTGACTRWKLYLWNRGEETLLYNSKLKLGVLQGKII